MVIERPEGQVDATIEEMAAGDQELAEEVRSLLGHLPDPETDRTSGSAVASSVDIEDLQGRGFGEFQLERLLGRGSHGVVYQGRQSRPDRTVAIKVIDTPAVGFHRARG